MANANFLDNDPFWTFNFYYRPEGKWLMNAGTEARLHFQKFFELKKSFHHRNHRLEKRFPIILL
jgi:hypothetical protein